ncbi:MAG: hypothetical protein OQL09_01910 [Gammaproteobacteria bacterium]|nr:hypothetical protein [Gammaproteobacteria bacterium]
MALPLAAVLTAAPGLISAAADIIRAIKDRKNTEPPAEVDKFDEMAGLIERQALVIEELALNNKNLVMEVKKNRIFSIVSLATGTLALVLAIWV